MSDGPMNAERLLAHYEKIADAPDAIARLRRFVLDLAVRGKLVPQKADDEPASELLERIAKEKARLVKAGEIRKPPTLEPSTDAEAHYALPRIWAWGRVGDIFDYDAGTKRDPKELDQSRWLLELEDIEKDTSRIIERLRVSDRDSQSTKSEFEPGDILYGKLRPYLNKVVVADEPGYSTTEIVAIRPFFRLCPEYCALAFRRPDFVAYVERLGRGTKMPRLRTPDAIVAPFPLPPLAEQHRIVAKVDELMGLCDRLAAARAGREAVRERLTAASLARLNAPDPETFESDARFALDALSALTTRPDQIKALRQTILNLAVRGKLVEGTTTKAASVGDYRTLQNGYAFKSSWFSKAGVRLLRNANIGHSEIRWNDVVHLPEDRLPEFERFRLNEGDIVLTLDRPFIVTGTKVARISADDLPSLLLQRVGRFVETSSGLDDDYLFLWINSPHFNDQIDPGRSNGVPHISSKQVEAAKIFVPPLAEQHRIVAKVDELMALCDAVEASLTATAATRRRLLVALLAEALAPVDAAELEVAE